MANTAAETICELRRTPNDDAYDVGTAGRLRATVICRAADVIDERSRVSADAYNRSESQGGKRTVASRCADSRMGGLQPCASLFRLSRPLRVGVEDAMRSTKFSTRRKFGCKLKFFGW